MSLKISYHTYMTWAVLMVVFIAAFFAGDRFGDAWEHQGWKFLLLLIYVCASAYAFIWLIQLRDDPTKDSLFKRHAGNAVIVGEVGILVSGGVLAYFTDIGLIPRTQYEWWQCSLSVTWFLAGIGLYYFQSRVLGKKDSGEPRLQNM